MYNICIKCGKVNPKPQIFRPYSSDAVITEN